MTYSICATDGTRHGVAIATKAPTVGSLAPFVTHNGAVSTQATVSIPIGVKATRLLDDGADIAAAVETLLARDEHADERQVHGVDVYGTTVLHSGENCVDWFGGIEGDDYTVAGNMLDGEHVVEAIAAGFEEAAGEPLAERLLAAIRAGEDAGGDKRAEHAQSAAVTVYDPESPQLEHDVRVDDHEDPVTELHRVYEVAKEQGEEWDDGFRKMNLQRNPK